MIINSETLLNLRTSLKTSFQAGFDGAASLWDKIAMKVTSETASNTYGWMGAFPRMREWLGERLVQNLATHDYAIKNRKFELTIGVQRDDIDDNNMAGYATISQGLGQEAKEHPDELIFELLKNGHLRTCYDGQNFFDIDHPVAGASVSNFADGAGPFWYLLDVSRPVKPLVFQERSAFEFTNLDKLDDPNVFMREEFLYGTRGRCNAGYGLWQLAYASRLPLTAENLQAARVAMQELKGDTGKTLNIRPGLLVVPPSLEGTAKTILNSETIQGSTNTMRNVAELMVSPYLH